MKIDPNELLYAYTQGYFPMAIPEEKNEVYWFKPELRGIIPLDSFHIPKNLKRLYDKGSFDLKINTSFSEVVRACAHRESTWISSDILDAYTALHELGYAMSFEAWKEGKLAGGLYGVCINKAFFGESMFFREKDASKIALVYLVEYLNNKDFRLLDIQYVNDHLLQFGAKEIEENEYDKLLAHALSQK